MINCCTEVNFEGYKFEIPIGYKETHNIAYYGLNALFIFPESQASNRNEDIMFSFGINGINIYIYDSSKKNQYDQKNVYFKPIDKTFKKEFLLGLLSEFKNDTTSITNNKEYLPSCQYLKIPLDEFISKYTKIGENIIKEQEKIKEEAIQKQKRNERLKIGVGIGGIVILCGVLIFFVIRIYFKSHNEDINDEMQYDTSTENLVDNESTID